jgi:glutathione S-transferase
MPSESWIRHTDGTKTKRTVGLARRPRYGIADIAAAPFVKRIDEEIAPAEVTAKQHSRVSEWWAKLQARPAFARANFGPFVES